MGATYDGMIAVCGGQPARVLGSVLAQRSLMHGDAALVRHHFIGVGHSCRKCRYTRSGKEILTGLRVETRYWEETSANGAKSATTQLARTCDTFFVRPAAQAVAQSRQDSFNKPSLMRGFR